MPVFCGAVFALVSRYVYPLTYARWCVYTHTHTLTRIGERTIASVETLKRTLLCCVVVSVLLFVVVVCTITAVTALVFLCLSLCGHVCVAAVFYVLVLLFVCMR